MNLVMEQPTPNGAEPAPEPAAKAPAEPDKPRANGAKRAHTK
jgi:hypothetical protein